MTNWIFVTATTMEEPLGERIGPFIFWPLLVILIVVIAWAMLKRRGRGGASGRAGMGGGEPATAWTRPEDYREHHRVAWDEDPSTFVPTASHWPLAVAAVFGICTGEPWDRFEFRKLDTARAGMQEAWGIRSRPQLLSRLLWILRAGHRLDYEQELADWVPLSEDAATAIIARCGKGGDDERELAWRLAQVRTNSRGIRQVRFEAWDLVRAAMLCRAGYSLGWLTKAEADDTLNLICAQLQGTYSSWGEMGEHFMLARWYWAADTDLEARKEEAHDISRQQALLDPSRGPWSHVPWSQAIPESRVLLAGASVNEELLTALPDPVSTPLGRIIDEAIASRLTNRA